MSKRRDRERKKRREAVEQLLLLYAQIPKIACQGKCQDYCGPIPCSSLEKERIEEIAVIPDIGPSLSCPMLTEEGRCSVYDRRPAVCRMWGVGYSMQCPYGCQVERIMTFEEECALLIAIHTLSAGLKGKTFAQADDDMEYIGCSLAEVLLDKERGVLKL